MEGKNNDAKKHAAFAHAGGEHWERFVKTGSVSDYLRFSSARSQARYAARIETENDTVKN